MGLFSKPEVVIARESTNAKVYLEKLEELLPEAEDEVKEKETERRNQQEAAMQAALAEQSSVANRNNAQAQQALQTT